ncbi:MAG: histidinol-phosphate transaminase [Candidatus Cloacimonadales bacterium]|nr:histidinol-phosphate transaminase [Candidatus Cloacimonadales bacterium]
MDYFRSDLKQKKPVNINVPQKKLKMGLNESTLNPMEIVQKHFLEKMEKVPLNRYFNGITDELRTKLAEYAEVAPDCLAFGNGADEMLYYIFTAVRENNDSFAVSLAPSYFDYRSYSGAVGLGIKFLSLQPDFDFSAADFLKLADSPNCKLVILCNPNNPTGNLLDEKKIIKVIESSNSLVLIDETYFEFSGKTFTDQIGKYPNLIIVRSFSKAFSAAGLRFGYVISHSENIRELEKVMTIFHLNLMTQAMVTTILKNKAIFLEHNRKVIEQKQFVFEELNKMESISVHPSATNFLTFSLGNRTEDLFNFMSENDIAIRPVWHHPVLKEHVRVTISGEEEENRLFLEKVKEFILNST